MKKLLLVTVFLAGCSGMVNVKTIDGLILDVSARHDAYVKSDTTITPAQQATYLRSTELLRAIVEEANK